MYTERPNICTCFTADPEDGQMSGVVELEQSAFMDGPDAQLPLDSGDQWWPLEQSSCKRLEHLRDGSLSAGDRVVEPYDADVLLSGALLRLDEARGAVDAYDQTSCHFRVERAGVSCLFHPVAEARTSAQVRQILWEYGWPLCRELT
jgi:hypothetical protein